MIGTQWWRYALLVALSLTTARCSDQPQDAEPPAELPEGPARSADEYLALTADSALFRSESIELGPDEERFLCFATTTEEYFQVGGYEIEAEGFLHHLVLARTIMPEPTGRSECEAMFRVTWDPLFSAAAGHTALAFPDGYAHEITRGTQLLLQVHLLNATSSPAEGHVEVRMRRIHDDDAQTLYGHIFGTMNFSLPAGQTTTVQKSCLVDDDLRVLAGFPHMHYLGTRLTFEAGPTAEAMDVMFERPVFSFDNQSVEAVDFTLQAGDVTRVTCEFDNYYDDTVRFGENAHNEMCFFIGFVAGQQGVGYCGWTLGNALQRIEQQTMVENDPAAGECADMEPNDDGIGLPCTANGDECPADTTCSAGLLPGDEGMCMRLGCTSDEDCGGGGATCCSPLGIDGAMVCIPEACRPPDFCIPAEAFQASVPEP